MIPSHFLVPTDFSDHAEQALDYAMRLAGTLGARLTLLHVIQPIPMAGVDMGVALPATYLEELEASSQRSMTDALARVTAAGIPADSAMTYGVPFQEITAMARAQHIDLIVMGTYGRTGLMHALLGSVAEQVVRLAPCAVLVVRRTATDAEG